MLAHKLKYLIEVWEKVQTKSSIGSMSVAEQLVDSVYADMQSSIGKVAANDDRILHQTETTFILRNYPVITYNHYIKYGADTYKVLAIQQLPDGSGQLIKTVRNG